MRLENAHQAVRGGGLSEQPTTTTRVNSNAERDQDHEAELPPTQIEANKTVRPAAAAQATTTRARTLSNLFRSKSLRIISSSGNNNHNQLSHNYQQQAHSRNQIHRPQQQQHQARIQGATIDYLSAAKPHKRSLSINRSSFFTASQADNSSDALSQKNFVATGGGGGKLVLFLRRLFRTKRSRKSRHEETENNMRQSSLERSRIIINNIHTSSTTSTAITPQSININSSNNDSNSSSGNSSGGKQYGQPRPGTNLLCSPSSDSSGSNSLIEILDCSPQVNSSRRALRSQHLARERNRASWRMVQRSDSSLSELSDCSTTASEQLRRHLDEAYKRHRNCTSQREKDFIDSINVLRQASRHALPQSGRSSSKTRHAATKSVASGKSDNETVSSLASHSSRLTSDLTADDCARNNQTSATTTMMMAALPQQQQANCCICAAYLESVARLCPLAAASAYCPAAATTGACCPVLVHGQTTTAATAAQTPPPPPTNPADMCMCPLWRSMISNYSSGCQSADSQLIFNPTSPAPQPLHHQHQQLLAHSPHSPQPHNHQHQQQQQQQHNTTIDLKIEIGAELSKQAGMKLAGTSNRRSFSAARKQHQSKVVAEADSLDSDYTTTTSASTSS